MQDGGGEVEKERWGDEKRKRCTVREGEAEEEEVRWGDEK